MMDAADYQLKFVITAPEELAEVDALVAGLGVVDPTRILLMPQALTAGELEERARWLVPLCQARGWRFCDRLHVRLFGNTRGT